MSKETPMNKIERELERIKLMEKILKTVTAIAAHLEIELDEEKPKGAK
jgi:hypothetical protein